MQTGVKLLPPRINELLFGNGSPHIRPQKLKHLQHITAVDDWGETRLPPLLLDDLHPDWLEDEANKEWSNWKHRLDKLVAAVPTELPNLFTMLWTETWCKFQEDTWVPIKPDELPDALVLDFETKDLNGIWHPVCCSAWGNDGFWYCYRSEWELEKRKPASLVPFPNNRLVTGFNISYDRAYLLSEYQGTPTTNRFIDTMSLLQVLHGISGKQKAQFLYAQNNPERGHPKWTYKAIDTYTSLAAATKFLFGETLDKSTRADIVKSSWDAWRDNQFWQEITKYCQSDVLATWRLLQRLYPKLQQHYYTQPFSWVGMLELSHNYICLDTSWIDYINDADRMYNATVNSHITLLKSQAERVLQEGPTEHTSCLEWRPLKSGPNKGKPKWHVDFCKNPTLGISAAPVILGLTMDNHRLSKVGKDWKYGDKTLTRPDGKTDIALQTPLTNTFQPLAATEIINSVYPEVNVKKLYEELVSLSNWKSLQSRIKKIDYTPTMFGPNKSDRRLSHIPNYVVHGTQTRRAADPVFLVAPKPLETRIGGELLGQIKAPPGYKIVGADFEACESWIFSVLGDWFHNPDEPFPGASEFSLAVLCGNKEKKTDIHSLMAQKLDLKRGVAKSANFALAYSAGVVSLANTFKLSALTPITEKEARQKASAFISTNKGDKQKIEPTKLAQYDVDEAALWVPFWSDELGESVDVKQTIQTYKTGIAKDSFSAVNLYASARCATPFLNVPMPESLHPSNTGRDFITTKSNWTIQSTGVDVLHILLTAIQALCKKHNLTYWPCLPIHDSVSYYVPDHQINQFKAVLQTTHLLCKAYCYKSLGFDTAPALTSFFSAVDVTSRLVKTEHNPSCKTISNPTGFTDWQ